MRYCFIFSFAMALSAAHGQNSKTYAVQKIRHDITITGTGNDPLWKNAQDLTDFIYPWEEHQTPSRTSFRAMHNKNWLYCLFDIHDPDIRIYVDTNDKREAVRSDRAEIFFMANRSMSPYYCLEIDPLARVFDCKGEFYRKLDTGWSWPAGELVVRAHRHEQGYSIEIAISKKSLIGLGLLKRNKINAGLYRADCVGLKGTEASFRWISWMRPDSDTPDFHIPSSFGTLKLE